MNDQPGIACGLRLLISSVLAVGLLGSSGCGGKETYRSPEEVFAAHCESQVSEDWDRFLGTMTPESRVMNVGGTAGFIMLEYAADDANGKELLERHGVNPDQYDLSLYGASPVERSPFRPHTQPLKKSLAESIRDHRGFLRDSMEFWKQRHLESAGQSGIDSPGPFIPDDDVELRNVVIEGDNATAEEVVRIGEITVRTPRHFKRINGCWYVDLTQTVVVGVERH